MKTRNILLAGVLATASLGAVGAAVAQSAATYDPAQLPAIQGKVAEYSLTPRGDVDGLILADGTEVYMPPHLGTRLSQAVKPGDAVTIRGLRARNLPLVQAMQVSNDASGASVTDTGPGDGPRDGPRGPRPPSGPDAAGGPGGPGAPDQPALTAQGRVKAALHGPRGDVNGALLEDGTIIRMPPPEAQRLASQIAPGATVYVRGPGYAGPLGRVIAARAIGADANSTTPVSAPARPRPWPGPPWRGRTWRRAGRTCRPARGAAVNPSPAGADWPAQRPPVPGWGRATSQAPRPDRFRNGDPGAALARHCPATPSYSTLRLTAPSALRHPPSPCLNGPKPERMIAGWRHHQPGGRQGWRRRRPRPRTGQGKLPERTARPGPPPSRCGGWTPSTC